MLTLMKLHYMNVHCTIVYKFPVLKYYITKHTSKTQGHPCLKYPPGISAVP